MKLTKKELRLIIKEEFEATINEGNKGPPRIRGAWRDTIDPPPDMDRPGWHPNMSQEWERDADSARRAEGQKFKKEFLSRQQAAWEDEFEVDDDREAAFIQSALEFAYKKIYEETYGPW